MRSASERLVRKLYKVTEGRPGMWLTIEGLGVAREIASDAERRGWVATVGGHSVRLAEGEALPAGLI